MTALSTRSPPPIGGPADGVPAATLPLTGERTVPGVPHENYWFQRHVAAYRFAATRCVGRDVVDAGSGEGYGAAMMARVATAVTGVERESYVIDHAVQTHPSVTFVGADVCATGLPDASADVVVSLQVIEHLPDVARFLTETRRVTRPGGQVIVATPNRLTFTPHDHEPTNIFHVEEFSAEELHGRLVDVGGFTVTQMLGLHHGHRIRAAEQATGQSFTDLVLQPVTDWPRWLHTLVARLDADDFTFAHSDIDSSLDLLAVCTR